MTKEELMKQIGKVIDDDSHYIEKPMMLIISQDLKELINDDHAFGLEIFYSTMCPSNSAYLMSKDQVIVAKRYENWFIKENGI